jgi:D-lactate dehydrogenase
MNIAVFSTKNWVRQSFDRAIESAGMNLTYLEARLDLNTATLAAKHDGVCVFVNDVLDAPVVHAWRTWA